MATRSPKEPKQAPQILDGDVAAPKAPRKARRAAMPPEEQEALARAKAHKAAAKAVKDKLNAVKKAAEPQPAPPTPLQVVGKAIALSAAARRISTLRAPSFKLPAIRVPAFHMPAIRIPPFRRPRFSRPRMPQFQFTFPRGAALKAAALVAALGVGWLLGAQTHDASARSPQIFDAVASLATRMDDVETATRQIQAQDFAGMKTSLATMQANVEASRAQTHMAIIEFSARVDKLDRETAARLAAAGRQAVDRFDRMDREISARLGEVGKAAAQTSQRVEKLEQRPATPLTTGVSLSLPSLAQPAPMALAPAPAAIQTFPAPQPVSPPLPPLPPMAIPGETTQVSPTPPRSAKASRIPVNGYVLREVRDGVAVLEGHTGLRQVTMGDAIPGAGTVRAIQKRGSEWVVVTSIGVIDGKAY